MRLDEDVALTLRVRDGGPFTGLTYKVCLPDKQPAQGNKRCGHIAKTREQITNKLATKDEGHTRLEEGFVWTWWYLGGHTSATDGSLYMKSKPGANVIILAVRPWPRQFRQRVRQRVSEK